MRRFNRMSPALVVALLATAFLAVGAIAFILAGLGGDRSQTTVTVRATVTPGSVSVNVNVPTVGAPTIVAPPTATSAPLATLPPTAVPPPTATPPTAPTPVPVPTQPPAPTTAPLPVPPAPATGQPEATPAAPPPAGQAGTTAPPAPPPLPPPPPSKPAPTAAAPAPPPPAAPPLAPAPAPAAASTPGTQPSGAGGFGNTQQDFQAAYGAPIGRTADGLEVYRTDAADIQAGFRDGRADRQRLVLREGKAMALEEARALARRLSPGDAQPVSASGEDSGRPTDRFRSSALVQVFEPSAFTNAEPGTFSVSYAPAGGTTVSGFEIRLGAAP